MGKPESPPATGATPTSPRRCSGSILPLRMESNLVKRLDEARERLGLKNRVAPRVASFTRLPRIHRIAALSRGQQPKASNAFVEVHSLCYSSSLRYSKLRPEILSIV